MSDHPRCQWCVVRDKKPIKAIKRVQSKTKWSLCSTCINLEIFRKSFVIKNM